jgi:minor extracellular protease Epr
MNLTRSSPKKVTITFILVTLILIVSFSTLMQTASAQSNNRLAVIIGFKEQKDTNEITARGGQVSYSYTYTQAVAASMPVNQLEALRNDPDIEYVEEDAPVYALAQTLPWGVSKIEAPVVWTSANKGTGIKVAVLDTGIDVAHTDLHVAGGATFVYGTSSYNDDNGHGTHCAGIVSALDNDIGVVGVAPEASIYAVKVLDYRGQGSYSSIISGIEWCISNGIKVISMSFGGSTNSQTLEAECNKAYTRGIVLVAAAGNNGPGSNTVGYPAAYSTVIAVAATDSNDVVASFSSRGPQLSVSAPGVSILSTYYGNRYAYMSGTSMACPHTTGTVALLLKSNSYTPAQVKNILQNTAKDLGSAGFDTSYGYGRINAANAVAAGQPTPDFSVTASPSSLSLSAGSQGSSTITLASLNGFSGIVGLSASTPNGWTTTELSPVSPNLASGGIATSTLTISVPVGTSGGAYPVQVTGTSGSITHSATITVNVPTPPTAPSAPRDLKAIAGNSQVSLSWSVPSNNGGSTISNYKIYRHTASTPETLLTTVGNVLTYTDNNVVNGVTYYYRLTAVNTVGESSPSNEVSATPAVTQIKTMAIAVTTDRATYSRSSSVFITVKATDTVTGARLSGASVSVTIRSSSGSTVATGTGTTDSTGTVLFVYRQGRIPVTGTFTVVAEVSLTGYQAGSGQTTFRFT